MLSFAKCMTVTCTGMLLVLWAVVAFGDRKPAQQPEPGINVVAVVTEVYDGDTITVAVTRTFRVRLLDCWAPEVRGNEAPDGLQAKAAMQDILPVGSSVLLEIPSDNTRRFDTTVSMGRVLGRVWKDKRDVSQEMVQTGWATATRPKKGQTWPVQPVQPVPQF